MLLLLIRLLLVSLLLIGLVLVNPQKVVKATSPPSCPCSSVVGALPLRKPKHADSNSFRRPVFTVLNPCFDTGRPLMEYVWPSR